MKIVYGNQTNEFINGTTCIATEYPLNDKDLNGAIVRINGRYPQHGYVVNRVCKELVYVIAGGGYITIEDERFALNEKDQVLIEPGEKYFFDGNFEMIVPCTPAWYPEQHETIL